MNRRGDPALEGAKHPHRQRPTLSSVADLKPPRLVAGGERGTIRSLTQYHRESVVRKLEGLTEDEARHVFVPSGTSLLWIVKHLTKAEFSGSASGSRDAMSSSSATRSYLPTASTPS